MEKEKKNKKDNKEIKEFTNKAGNITVSEAVISTIVRNTILEIEGVNSISGDKKSNVLEVISSKTFKRNHKIKVNIKNNAELFVEISLVLNYGTNVIETSKAVQEKVKEAIENVVGMHVAEINIIVEQIATVNQA